MYISIKYISMYISMYPLTQITVYFFCQLHVPIMTADATYLPESTVFLLDLDNVSDLLFLVLVTQQLGVVTTQSLHLSLHVLGLTWRHTTVLFICLLDLTLFLTHHLGLRMNKEHCSFDFALFSTLVGLYYDRQCTKQGFLHK